MISVAYSDKQIKIFNINTGVSITSIQLDRYVSNIWLIKDKLVVILQNKFIYLYSK